MGLAVIGLVVIARGGPRAIAHTSHFTALF